MKKQLLSTLVCAALGIAAVSFDAAAQAPGLAPVVADISVITATVEAVDMANRVVTLKDGSGNTAVLSVPKGVTTFDTIKKGDTFVVEYAEAMAVGLSLAPKGSQPGTSVMRKVTVSANAVQRPFADEVDTSFTSAKITYINAAARLAILQPANGKAIRVKVDKQVLGLEKFKVGDEVIVEIVTDLVIGFAPPVGK